MSETSPTTVMRTCTSDQTALFDGLTLTTFVEIDEIALFDIHVVHKSHIFYYYYFSYS